MIRTIGEAGIGDIIEAVRHARTVLGEIRRLTTMADEELWPMLKTLAHPTNLSKRPRNSVACR